MLTVEQIQQKGGLHINHDIQVFGQIIRNIGHIQGDSRQTRISVILPVQLYLYLLLHLHLEKSCVNRPCRDKMVNVFVVGSKCEHTTTVYTESGCVPILVFTMSLSFSCIETSSSSIWTSVAYAPALNNWESLRPALHLLDDIGSALCNASPFASTCASRFHELGSLPTGRLFCLAAVASSFLTTKAPTLK